jgi:hypothetical protein
MPLLEQRDVITKEGKENGRSIERDLVVKND